MAEGRSAAACEDRGARLLEGRGGGTAHGVNAGVLAVETAVADAAGDRLAVESEPEQLFASDVALPPASFTGECQVDRVSHVRVGLRGEYDS